MNDPRPPASEPLPRGTPAPDFRLPSIEAAAQPPGRQPSPEQWCSRDQLRGAPAVLIFYPADFTPVCGDELAIFGELLPELERLGARVLGISVDSVWCHRAFADARQLRFPLLADYQPKGEVARRFGCYREEDGFSERALFVLDREGDVAWSCVSPLDVNPGVDGVLDALEGLAAGPRDDASDPAPGRGGDAGESREARS